MNKLGYWLVMALLAVSTVMAFRYTVAHFHSESGLYALFGTLVLFAVLLAFGLSMRDGSRRSRPIPRSSGIPTAPVR